MLNEVAKENPNLWRAWQSGYLADGDYGTLALLVPSVSGDVERGKYASRRHGTGD